MRKNPNKNLIMRIFTGIRIQGPVRSVVMSFAVLAVSACSPDRSVTWEIDNLEKIGGHPVEVIGDPQVVDTGSGKAVEFDGNGDQLFVDCNPIGDARAFTVEVVFKPHASYPRNTAPRFIHIQDPGDKDGKRLMIELRINHNNQCYLDAFLQTDSDELTLVDSSLVHPTEQWLRAAVVYSDSVLSTYINGEKELSGHVGFSEKVINPTGKTSIGGRMNHVAWFNGQVRYLKVTPRALDPEDFMQIND